MIVQILALSLAAGCCRNSPPAAAVAMSLPIKPLSPVDRAIRNGQRFLLDQQYADGSWDAGPFQRTYTTAAWWESMQGNSSDGATALVTYALLQTGRNLPDRSIAKAVEYLEKTPMTGVYALSMRLQVWVVLFQRSGQDEFMRRAKADAATLMGETFANGKLEGLWPNPNQPQAVDYNLAQYPILALAAAEQIGIKVPIQFWYAFDGAWRRGQYPDGGWSPHDQPAPNSDPWNQQANQPSAPTDLATTAAGIVSLTITHQHLVAAFPDWAKKEDYALESPDFLMDHVVRDTTYVYDMSAIARAGTISNKRKFGKHDWRTQFTANLLGAQHRDGSWTSGLAPIPGTAIALLTLASDGN